MFYTIVLSVAPIVGLVSTLIVAVLPADSRIAVALAMIQPDTTGMYGFDYVRSLIPERNVILLVLMNIPVLLIWRKTGRRDKMVEAQLGDFELLTGSTTVVERAQKIDSQPTRKYGEDHMRSSGHAKRKWQITQTTASSIYVVGQYLQSLFMFEMWVWLWKSQVMYCGVLLLSPWRTHPSDRYISSEKRNEATDWMLEKARGQTNDDNVCDTGRNVKPETYKQVLRKRNNRLTLYKRLPLKSASRLWGQLNQLELPLWLRPYAIRLYAWMFSCALDELAITDLNHYKNLSEFFRRALKPGVRPVGSGQMTSPADGTVLHVCRIDDGMLEQVKGVTYSLRGFMGPAKDIHPKYISALPINKSLSTADLGRLIRHNNSCHSGLHRRSHVDEEVEFATSEGQFARQLLVNPENELFQCIVYLSPGDYHRFHSPADWTVFSRRHFPGELFSVNPGVARWLQGLFNYNERVLYCGKWRHGFFSMTAVGATNVGSIHIPFDKELKTNDPKKGKGDLFYDCTFSGKKGNGVVQKKGAEFGFFNLGSTIVLIFEAPPRFAFSVRAGQKVKYGQTLGSYAKKCKGARKTRS